MLIGKSDASLLSGTRGQESTGHLLAEAIRQPFVLLRQSRACWKAWRRWSRAARRAFRVVNIPMRPTTPRATMTTIQKSHPSVVNMLLGPESELSTRAYR